MITKITEEDVTRVAEYSAYVEEISSNLQDVFTLLQSIAAINICLVSQEDVDTLREFLILSKSA